MILTCPNCGTQYVVKDGAVPPEGRQVRCAACKHSWHQDPEPDASTVAPADEAPQMIEPSAESESDQPAEGSSEDETIAEATLIDPRSGPQAEQRAYEEAVIENNADVPAEGAAEPTPGYDRIARLRNRLSEAAPDYEASAVDPMPAVAATPDQREPFAQQPATDMFTPFAAEATQSRRRSAAATIVILLLVVVLVAALFWFFAPAGLKSKLGLASAGATPLQLVTTHMDRQHLESGNDLLTLTGRIINPSAKEQSIPPIQAKLKDKSGKVVYSWTIPAPAPTLAAGSSAPFNSAEVSVPPNGDELTITLGDSKAAGI